MSNAATYALWFSLALFLGIIISSYAGNSAGTTRVAGKTPEEEKKLQAEDRRRAAEWKIKNAQLHTYMAMGCSILVLLSALYIVVSQSGDSSQAKWAYGAIGTVLGFWLRKTTP